MTYTLLVSPLCAQAGRQAAAHQQPATDSAAQASPSVPSAANAGHAVDDATNASQIGPIPRDEFLPGGTEIHVHLSRALSSGSAHNGEMIAGVLDSPVRTSAGHTLSAGTQVSVTVVIAIPAGKMQSAGEITLQATKVGGIEVYSDEVTHRGEIGPREMPDSNPAKGTEGTVAANAALIFKVSPPPSL